MPERKLFSGSSPLRVAANRRNALKSTGPRTAAGKRRVALNTLKKNLCSAELEKQLRARGLDPRDFQHLHRDLIAIFHPKAKAAFEAVELLARTWWEKACRIRAWVGAGPPNTLDLDLKLEELMHCVVFLKRMRHEWWQKELWSVLGRRPLPTPAAVRCAVEARLSLFGATKAKRRYPRKHFRPELVKHFEDLRNMLAELARPSAQAHTQGSRV
jgi:hypothetical protein